MSADRKIGAYICRGCGIGERLNIDRLEMIATGAGKAALARSHDMLCSRDGRSLIRGDIDSGMINQILIAACSGRAKVEAFGFAEATLARTNLREGVIWVRPDGDAYQETTQEMADDYVRMGCAEVRFMTLPGSRKEPAPNKRILVVGGGITGMTAAIEAAAAGYPVSIVEKTNALGGHAGRLYRSTPDRWPYTDPRTTGIAEMIAAVERSDRIRVHLNSTLSRTSGAPGRFSAQITTRSGATTKVNFGAIVQASGFKPYDANRLSEFAYDKTPDVITNMELEALARSANGGPIERPSDGREVKSVAFVQCAGQRSDKAGHLPYCSGFCCATSIKQAMYFKDVNPDVDTTVLFSDLRTPGAPGEGFYRSGQHKGILFCKGQVFEVIAGDDTLEVRFKDLILNEETALQCDLLVLATGMLANSGPDPCAAPMEEEAADDPTLEPGGESILNLDYRQGTDLPHLRHGFTDSHFICFPYETRRTGIYAAGPVRRPMDIPQAREDATGAAMKAIQAVENAARGRAAHPRVGDLSYPSFRKEGCTQCKRCTVECPFGAIDEDEQRYPVFNESRCRRCGICMGACPVRVISFETYSVDTVGQQIKHCDIPASFQQKPRILVLACENDAYPALDQAAMNGAEIVPWARVIPVRCLGSVNLSWITDAISSGYDGVVLMGCRRDEDYQCHFIRGSAIAAERMSKVSDTLQTLNLEPERVGIYQVAITDVEKAPRLINDMAATVDKIGMSPFKF